MGVYVREKHGRWYVDIVDGGRHHWRALGMRIAKDAAEYKKQKALAEAVRFKLEYSMTAERLGVKEALADFDAGKVTLEKYAMQVAENGTRSGAAAIQKMLRYAREFDRGVTMGAITAEWMESFQRYLERDAQIKASSARLYAAALRTVLHKAEIAGVIRKNPCSKVKNIKASEANKPVLTVEELQRLEAVQGESEREREVYRAFLFACNTGLRVSDLQTLEWGEIEAKDGQWVMRKKQKKTGGVVEVVLNKTAARMAGAGAVLHMADEKVFALGDAGGANKTIKAWAAAAGITKDISWHTARRTFATLLLEAGADVFTTQRLMGHTKIQMTSVYAKSGTELKARAVEALDALQKGKTSKAHELQA